MSKDDKRCIKVKQKREDGTETAENGMYFSRP